MPRVTGLGHVGLWVKDPQKMTEFYSDFLGMTVTDRAEDDRIVFLSAIPDEEHHELALAKRDEVHNDVQQVSFRVGSIEDLLDFYKQIVERKYPIDRTVNHGIALGCYFNDPEGNRVEVYWPTGRDVPQPRGDLIDLGQSKEALIAEVDALPTRKR